MSSTIGIAVKDEKSKTEMMGQFKTLPGETDADRLRFCLNAALQSAKLSGKPYESLVEKVRASQGRTIDLLVSTLMASDVEYENKLAEKDRTIVAQEEEIRTLKQEKKNALMSMEQAKSTIADLKTNIESMEKALATKEELIASLRNAQNYHDSQVSHEADINARLKVIEDKLQAINGAQLSFISPN